MTATTFRCDRPDHRSPEPHPLTQTPETREPESGDAEPEPAPVDCDQQRRAAQARLDESLAPHRRCRWDVDCVTVPPDDRCPWLCPTTAAASGVVSARAATRAACEALATDACASGAAGCAANGPVACVDGTCHELTGDESQRSRPEVDVPPENARSRSTPPERPPPGDAEERARRLFDAIVNDDPDRTMDFFFPREAFLVLKGMADPGQYYDRLLARYLQDIHTLHADTPRLDEAEYVRLELIRRGGWVGVGEEGNRLPYWVSRHSRIVYRVGSEERTLEVRVLITWGQRWYITHLSEFH